GEPIGMPHFPQNLIPAGYCCLQRGHATMVCAAGGGLLPVLSRPDTAAVTNLNLEWPHRPQNFIPSAKREPQLTQATMRGVFATPPARLSRLPPLEGVNGALVGALLNCA